MSDIAELHAHALGQTGRIVAGINPGQWQPDTPCAGWDLAVATGQDPELDPAHLQACRAVIEPQVAAFRAAGVFGDEQPVPPGATEQQRFLAMLGRLG